MNIVVIAPHPDDAELWVGGTIIWHIENGDKVSVIYATKGERGTWTNVSFKRLAHIREIEAKRSAEIMGINNVIFLRLQDRSIICDRNSLNLLKEELIKLQPDIIYAPEYKHSFLPIKDHTNLGLIVKEIYKNKKYRLRLYHSMHSNIFVDISPYHIKVNKALRMHHTQISFKAFPPCILRVGLFYRLFLIKFWGEIYGCKFAEGFREL